MALAIGDYTYITMRGIGKGLTYREAQAGALYIIVNLEETLEYLFMSLRGNACACVFAVNVKSIVRLTVDGAILCAVAQLDVALSGVLKSVGKEIDYYLRNAIGIDINAELRVGVIVNKLQTGLLNTWAHGVEQLVESAGEVDIDRLYLHMA